MWIFLVFLLTALVIAVAQAGDATAKIKVPLILGYNAPLEALAIADSNGGKMTQPLVFTLTFMPGRSFFVTFGPDGKALKIQRSHFVPGCHRQRLEN